MQKTIKIFLYDEKPTGTKIVEVSNWSGKAYIIPRNRITNIFKDTSVRNDLSKQSVYLLFGKTESNRDKVYVGEAEIFIERILQHNNKDFWNYVICFFSKDENLNKAHVKYLESILSNKIKVANRVDLENNITPPKPGLSQTDRVEMEEFLIYIELALSTLGFTFLENIQSEGYYDKDIFYCKSFRAEGKGTMTDEGFIVFRGSKISPVETKSVSPGLSKLRKVSKELGEIDINTNTLIHNKLFSSPSYAGGFVLGMSVNGWSVWKNKIGKTLDEIKRR